MKRGSIFYANLDPTLGKEIKKRRPVLIVSNNANNQNSSVVTILPISSNVTKVFPFEVLLSTEISGLPKPSKVLAQQIRTIDKLRLGPKPVAILEEKIMIRIARAIQLHLAL